MNNSDSNPGVGPRTVRRDRERILDSWIDVVDWDTALSRISTWAQTATARVVCICNVHSVVTARSDAVLRHAIDHSDLATPDGMPLAWLIGRRRRRAQPRVNGPDLTLRLCELAAAQGLRVGFYGSTPDTLRQLEAALRRRFPALQIACLISPPFGEIPAAQRVALVAEINAARPAILFVGLGCPKQEHWMAAQRESVASVMIGVGAAFDYIAGTVRRPPRWMQVSGLEWLGRLIAEPRRLWRRYLVTNSIFLFCILRGALRSTAGRVQPESESE